MLGLFKNRNLPSTSGSQLRVTAMASVAWGDFWTSLANNSEGGFLCLVLGVLLDNLCPLVGHYHFQRY